MRKTLVGTAIVTIAAIAVFLFTRSGGAETRSYRFVTVERGDIEAVVAATGQLSAVTTVQVGTQVSGQVRDIYVDFNDRVKKGQLIARIDPTLLLQAVRSQEANLERIQAELAQNEWEFERTKELYAQQGVSESEFKQAEYQVAVSRSNLRSAEINLEQARRNLAYSEIYAPIDGVVVERNVEPGQTVAASLSAPQLFLIANDLSQMEILASVDESDIGQIREGQEVRFTVQAYPDEMFTGTVRQVRLQSAVQENVVNYTVVVSVQNPDGRLLPGMTATVDFVVERVQDVLKVPNAALRFRPSPAMIQEVQERMRAARERRLAERRVAGGTPAAPGDRVADGEIADSLRERFRQAREAGARPGGGEGPGGRPDGAGFGTRAGGDQLWYVDADGQLQVARVQVGVSDGQYTEVRGRNLEDGMEVIAGVLREAAPSTPTNPFQQQNDRRGGFGRGF